MTVQQNKPRNAQHSKSHRPVHHEHLNEVMTQESVPSWLASVVVHLALLVIMLLIPAVAVERGAFGPIEYVAGQPDAPPDDIINLAVNDEQHEVYKRPEAIVRTDHNQHWSDIERLYKVQPGLESDMTIDFNIGSPQFYGIGQNRRGVGDGGDLGGYIKGTPFGRERTILSGRGVDLVIAFDSTDSMQPTIDEVKKNIGVLIELTHRLVKNTQIGILTYRDYNDEFIVRGLRLGATTEAILKFLEPINAGGGGVYPECVMLAMRSAVLDNEGRWRERARRVVVLIGDAPPHANEVEETYTIVRQFHADGGIVSVIDTSPANRPVAELEQIAKLGGGHYHRLVGGDRDASGLAVEIFIQIFGEAHRKDLIKIWDGETGRMRIRPEDGRQGGQ